MTEVESGEGVRALEEALRREVEGEVRFDAGTRAVYASDASNYRHPPIGVVTPRSIGDVEAVLAVCRAHDVPVLSRGGGTSLAGQCCNTAVIIDWSRHLHHVLSIDPERKVARVEPGCVLDRLRRRAGAYGLTFGPDPATHDHCTLGGMIGNNSCGIRSMVAGRTSDNVEALQILTYRGDRFTVAEGGVRGDASLTATTILHGLEHLRDRYGEEIRRRFPDIPRRVSGYNLDELLPEHGFHVARALVGSEGTCVTVVEAEVRLIDDPPAKSLLVLGYPDVMAAADDVCEVAAAGPRGLEGMDSKLHSWSAQKHLHPDAPALLPTGDGWLFVEFGGGTKEEADAAARKLMARLSRRARPPSMRLFDDPEAERQVWLVRESGLGATARIPAGADTWPGWEDSAVAPERLGAYLRDLHELTTSYGYEAALYGHFGQGCVHARFSFDLVTALGVEQFRSFLTDAAELVVSYGGSLSGEHGDGQGRAELLGTMFGADIVDAFGAFKALWDPDAKMNPGRVVDPRPLDADLRLGSGYRPAEPVTFFRYPHDDGRFSRAALRCVGVGKCRREDDALMCPSYQVTRDEQHSTRGRARLLFEMLQGDLITDGWRSAQVRDALDLCLACKGCRGECPMRVDMATYKAEFLAHHYAGRLRPAAHYSMGWLPLLARAASHAPRTVNTVLATPGLRSAARAAAGIDQRRALPRFATRTARQRLGTPPRSGGRRVVLLTDTFTNHFDPDIAVAAAQVLADAGLDPVLTSRPVCCGLTWISTGQLRTAKRVLRRTLDTLRPELRAGTPVLGLEPSCTAVFRNDLPELLADDEDAHRLAAQTFTLADLLGRFAPHWQPPTIGGEVVVQEHCHHKAVLGVDSERKLLERAGVEARRPEPGCCGLAGNFGFERGHYDVSMACAERALLPAVRDAGQLPIVADGFSCRTQILQATGRRPLHITELLANALPGRRP